MKQEMKIKVEGMVCGGCEKRVENAVKEIEGVKKVTANHKKGIVTVMAEEGVSKETVQEAIQDIGFEIVEE